VRYDDPRWYEKNDEDDQQALPANTGDTTPVEQALPATMNAQQPQGKESQSQRRQRIFGQVIVTLTFMAVAFLGGWFANQAYSLSLLHSSNSQAQKYGDLFQQAWNIVQQNYVDRNSANYQQMSYAAISAMLNELGDTGHTRFLTPQDLQSETQSLSGSYAGIGVYIQQDAKTKVISIVSTIPGSPAAKVGVKAGDIVTKVNGKNVTDMLLSAVEPLIQGPTGTSVNITFKRPSTGHTLTLTMTRAQIQVPNVEMHYIPEDHIADIEIIQFASGTSDQLKTALLQAKKDGATKIILDLRNNPGGYLNEAISTASEFMTSGTVLIEQDSSGHQTKFNVTGQPVAASIPMVVLVNSNTASAAEIVSGALQDNGRSLIMGTKTFGTGTVLQEFDLSDGSAILLGVDEWLTPKGHFIRKDKITPNIIVQMNANDPILTPDIETQNNMTLQQILKSGDTQLAAAIQYLQSH
jgi:carboxyl-terminal processing protease